ncbi:unnamed protein product [Urochloa decumbens]|uniref:DUF6598 domain-containing protein n=1 Tax=Urochloa decumbens TaxID=240449 RepID=A0ABC8Z0N1_9POAL
MDDSVILEEIKPRDVAAFEDLWKGEWRHDERHQDLLAPLHTWELKVVTVLHVIRRRQLTEYNSKKYRSRPTRFCDLNVAFFDHDKESEVVHGPLFREVCPSQYCQLDGSINIISIKVAESDMRYPIKIYGTVLARDQNDYRCVYLFKRERDDPQLITTRNPMLPLTGPYRALGGRSHMYFEFHLKIKAEGAVDEDFSKGYSYRDVVCDTRGTPNTSSFENCLSRMELLYVPVSSALEASVGVNFLSGKSCFTGKISASTSRNDMNKVVLYDSKVRGTETKLGSGGSVPLTRHTVAVPLGEDLVLYAFVRGVNGDKPWRLKFVVGHDVEERTCRRDNYELQVKIIWKAVFRQDLDVWKEIEGVRVLW